MKKYNKPTVEVVSLSSSENIAKTTFKNLRKQFIEGNMYKDTNYAISTYAVTNSVVDTKIVG